MQEKCLKLEAGRLGGEEAGKLGAGSREHEERYK
jgi:hypothetical protein